MTTPKPSEAELYGLLLTANEVAFAAGHYETAYHALMAALHNAEDRNDAEALEAIAKRAAAQQGELDVAVPAHALSTQTATNNGRTPIYRMAADQAHMQGVLLRRRAT